MGCLNAIDAPKSGSQLENCLPVFSLPAVCDTVEQDLAAARAAVDSKINLSASEKHILVGNKNEEGMILTGAVAVSISEKEGEGLDVREYAARVERLRLLFEAVSVRVDERICDFVLCSGAFPFPTPSSSSSSAADPSDVVKSTLTELVSCFRNALRMILFPFVGSRENFLKIPSTDLRNEVVLLVLEQNYRLDGICRRHLPVASFCYQPCPMQLVGPSQMLQVSEWYHASIVREVKKWFRTTLRSPTTANSSSSSSTAADNSGFGLPWGLQTVDQKVISVIPEMLSRYTMSFADFFVYLGNDKSSGTGGLLGHSYKENSSREGLVMTEVELSMMMSAQVSFAVSDAELDASGMSSQHTTSSFALQRERDRESWVGDGVSVPVMGEFEGGGEDDGRGHSDRCVDVQMAPTLALLKTAMLNALATSWLLLAEEYKRALQSKHWKHPFDDTAHSTNSSKSERKEVDVQEFASQQQIRVNAFLDFLVACVNDSSRVSAIHLENLNAMLISSKVIGSADKLNIVDENIENSKNECSKTITKVSNSIQSEHALLAPPAK